MKIKLVNILVAIPIGLIIALVFYENILKDKSTRETYTDNKIEVSKETRKTKEEPKEIELSREEAYNEILSYNKIYNWLYMFEKDKNYEPAKEYKYKNPELTMTSNIIKLNSQIYDVIDYKVIKSYINNDLVSIVFKFKIIGGEASFYHNLERECKSIIMRESKEYYFELINNTSAISICCTNQITAPIEFYLLE